MDRSLVKWSHLIDIKGVLDNPASRPVVAWDVENTILRRHLHNDRAGSNNLKLSSSQMNMRSVETARTKKAKRHSRSRAHESWEGLSIGSQNIASLACITACELAEVEDEVLVLVQDCETVGSGVGDGELGGAGESWSGGWCGGGGWSGAGLTDVWLWCCEGGGREDGEGEGGGELHFDCVDCGGQLIDLWLYVLIELIEVCELF